MTPMTGAGGEIDSIRSTRTAAAFNCVCGEVCQSHVLQAEKYTPVALAQQL
jgi:hypothetical protein